MIVACYECDGRGHNWLGDACFWCIGRGLGTHRNLPVAAIDCPLCDGVGTEDELSDCCPECDGEGSVYCISEDGVRLKVIDGELTEFARYRPAGGAK